MFSGGGGKARGNFNMTRESRAEKVGQRGNSREGRQEGERGFSRILHYAVTALKIKALSLLGAMSLLTHSGSTFLLFHQIIEGTPK